MESILLINDQKLLWSVLAHGHTHSLSLESTDARVKPLLACVCMCVSDRLCYRAVFVRLTGCVYSRSYISERQTGSIVSAHYLSKTHE